MSDAHESYLQELFGGKISKGSGNQAANPADVRQSPTEEVFPFAWDGKSTLSHSINISLDTLHKIEYQAHNLHPGIAIRFYLNERLTEAEDWCLVKADDLRELQEKANG
jgi:hypothetical protein